MSSPAASPTESTAPTVAAAPLRAEIVIEGLVGAPGIAIGVAYHFRPEQLASATVRPLLSSEVPTELARLDEALDKAEHELRKIASITLQKLGDGGAEIFEAQILMLRDPYLVNAIRDRIVAEQIAADSVVEAEISRYQHLLELAGDDYLAERGADMADVRDRILRNLRQGKRTSQIEPNRIVIAADLSPADVILFSRRDPLGFALDFGGVTGHTAILTRSLGLPSVLGLHRVTSMVESGDPVIVDGYRGRLIAFPTAETTASYEREREARAQTTARLDELHDLPAVTSDGKRRIHLVSNLEFVEELDAMAAGGGEGVGLFRTEHLFLAQGRFPSEEEQTATYRALLSRAAPLPVTIRTFDLGGDKVLPEISYTEANPFLGWRGIRILIDRPELFHTQLRAILRASVEGKAKIMFPMIGGLEEARAARAALVRAQDSLREDGIPFDPTVPIGVMIEVPSAALMADELAREVDFFSIGTNDLVQYLLAVDRTNDIITSYYQPLHPAVLRTVRHIIRSGHEAGIPVAMCGELAATPLATIPLVGLGLDEFSVVSPALANIKRIIRSTTLADAERVAAEALALPTVEAVVACLTHYHAAL